ncbi:hypothetical protein PVK06_048621 [Gossypium arboreum]|uniref:Uncharacterized protein n=1 Tax=Gossypium arboreum TaxID=29729 RepID=A0ABR0MGF7_GOSAR|nr:hypothetical protein PVK06_048621 [Gossypium arboreum]
MRSLGDKSRDNQGDLGEGSRFDVLGKNQELTEVEEANMGTIDFNDGAGLKVGKADASPFHLQTVQVLGGLDSNRNRVVKLSKIVQIMTKGSTSFTFSEKSASLTGIEASIKGIAEGIQRESEFGTFTCRDSVAMEGVDVAEACNIQVEIGSPSNSPNFNSLNKSQFVWLTNGDRNTKYFHNRARTRRKSNEIEGLIIGNGVWCFDDDKLRQHAVGYFQELYTARLRVAGTFSCHGMFLLLSLNDRDLLSMEATSEKIYKAASSMAPPKAPGIEIKRRFSFHKHLGEITSVICEDIGVSRVDDLGKYLGMPIFNQRVTKDDGQVVNFLNDTWLRHIGLPKDLFEGPGVLDETLRACDMTDVSGMGLAWTTSFVNSKSCKLHRIQKVSGDHWSLPEKRRVKLNTDGALFESNNIVAIG